MSGAERGKILAQWNKAVASAKAFHD
jgi:hypothetical protein